MHSALKTVHWALKNWVSAPSNCFMRRNCWRCCDETTEQCCVEITQLCCGDTTRQCCSDTTRQCCNETTTAVLRRKCSKISWRNLPLIVTLSYMKQIIFKTLPIAERYSKKAAYLSIDESRYTWMTNRDEYWDTCRCNVLRPGTKKGCNYKRYSRRWKLLIKL